MPDFSKILQEKIASKDQSLSDGAYVGMNENELTQQSEQPQEPKTWGDERRIKREAEEQAKSQETPALEEQASGLPSQEELTNELFRQERQPMGQAQNVPENPFTWTPEYTERGFVEEVGNSLMRGFGKHVIGGTGDIIQLANGVLPGFEIREGNMISRALQEYGKEFEEEYKTYMPEELKNPEFSMKSFLNPDFWSKQAAEYIPQLVEMIFISRGLGGAAKGLARKGTKTLTEGMTKQQLRQYGKATVKNTTERVAGGAAKQVDEIAGQSQGWRSMFMTNTGEATAAFQTGSELVGGGIGMNFLAGLQNAGQLVNDLKYEKDPETGEFLYSEEELGEAARRTMVENMKYLPVDMLSYGFTYARNSGKLSKALNPFRKKGKKAFYSQAEQLTASSKALQHEITPLMNVLKKAQAKIMRNAERGRKTANMAFKPVLEGFEETFQESWEEWSVKKARARVTGEPITIDGKEVNDGLNNFMNFYLSKENEGTKTIAMALGVLGGSASNIVTAINQKANTAFSNYSKTELLKNAATDKDGYLLQSKLIKERLVDNALEGNIDNEAYIQTLADNEVISEDDKVMWTELSSELKEDAQKAKDIGLNVSGQLAYLENKTAKKVAELNYKTEEETVKRNIQTAKEEFKNDPQKQKAKIKEIEEAWDSAKEGFKRRITTAEQGALSIMSKEKAEVSNIKHVKSSQGHTVAIELSEADYNEWYEKSDEEIYEAAKKKITPSLGKMGKAGSILRNIYNNVSESISNNIPDKYKKEDQKSEKQKTDKTKDVPEIKFTEEPISKEEVESFQKDQTISPERLNTIAKKVQASEPLNKVEQSMYNAKKSEINKVAETIAINNIDAVADNNPVDPILDEKEITKEEDKAIEKLENTKPRAATTVDSAIQSTIKKDSDETIESVEDELIDEIREAKVNTENKAEAKKAIEKIISESKGKIGEVGRANVSQQGFVNYLYKLATEGKTSKEKAKEAKSNKKKVAELKKKREAKLAYIKSRPEYINAKQIQESRAFNDETRANFIGKIAKASPQQKAKLQNQYEQYLSSTIARVSMKPSVMVKQIAVNQHLMRMFPEQRIQAYAAKNLFDTIGENALGYTLGSAIMIDEKAWEQDDVFMHEFLHIHFAVSQDTPETKAILNEAQKDKQLLKQVLRNYEDQIIYEYYPPNWRPPMAKMQAMKRDMTPEEIQRLETQLKQKLAKALPLDKQDVIKDELFVAYMQADMSERYSKFFTNKPAFKRRKTVQNWWKNIKNRALNNEEEYYDVVKHLNNGKTVPVAKLKEHIMNNFASSIKNNDVTVQGRFSKSKDEALLQNERYKEIQERLVEADTGKIYGPKAADVAENENLNLTNDEDIEKANQPTEEEQSIFQSTDEILNEINNSTDMDLGTFWDKGFDAANLKMNKILSYFVEQYNVVDKIDQDIRYLKGELEANLKPGLNLNDFKEVLMDTSKASPSHIAFIETLEQSDNKTIKSFVDHLKSVYGKDALPKLRTMHFLYSNSEVLPAVIKRVNADGSYETVFAESSQDKYVADRVKNRIYEFSVEQRETLLDDLQMVLMSQTAKPEVIKAVKRIIKAYGPNNSLSQKIANSGQIITNKKMTSSYVAIKQFLKEGLGENESLTENADGLIKALLITSKEFDSASSQYNAQGRLTANRMFGNFATRLMKGITADLAKSNNTKKEKFEFFKKYSNLRDNDMAQNPILDAFWENYHNNGDKPLMVLDFGTKNDIHNKSKAYKNASANQQILNELLEFNEEKTSLEDENTPESYFGSMDIFGDSSRRLLMSMPKLELQKDGSYPTQHLYKIHSIYEKLNQTKQDLLDNKKRQASVSRFDFKKAIDNDVNAFIDYVENNLDEFSKLSYFENKIKKGKLSPEGKKDIKKFIFNRVANTLYMHEMTSPGVNIDSITKRHKGLIAPVQQLDPNLKVEMIPAANEYKIPMPLKTEEQFNPNGEFDKAKYRKAVENWKKNSILTNDGIQYILEDDAKEIQTMNPDFGRGYKLFSHTIEKENPYFMNSTSQMKGYTTVLTEEEVTTGSQQHLKPYYDMLVKRRKKFMDWYENEYKEKYNPKYDVESGNGKRPKYIGIITPVSADKTSLFETNELLELNEKYTLKQLEDPDTREEYMNILDKMWYPKSRDFKFYGLNGSNFGPQQIMDKRYQAATLSIQSVASILYGRQTSALNFENALKAQEFIAKQKEVNLQKLVLDELTDPDTGAITDEKIAQFILNKANPLDSDPYTLRALKDKGKAYDPRIGEFATNQIRSNIIRNGNNLKVAGTYGQTISDMGYKYTRGSRELFTNKPNRDKTYPGTEGKEQYINGSSGLQFYGIDEDGKTIPMEIILPKQQDGDTTVARKEYFGKSDGGRQAAYNAVIKDENTLKRLKLWKDGKPDEEGLNKLLDNNKIYSDKESTDHIGTYIPGDLVMMTRIPHNGPAFVGVAEVVGFHTTDASNIIVPAEYTSIIGADHDGDALFVYKQAKFKNGAVDRRTDKGYGNWNNAFDLMVNQWAEPDMRETLTTPLNFENRTDETIAKIRRNLDPKKYAEFDKLSKQFNNNEITEKQYNQKLKEINTKNDFVIPFGYEHYKSQYNNAVIAQQTVGVAFNLHRALNMLSAYQTTITNGINAKGVPNISYISINGKTQSQFSDLKGRGANSRIQVSTTLANIVLDSAKNGHADDLNLNLSSIGSAMILANLGFSIEDIGFVLNHPAAKEFIERRNDIDNDFLNVGTYQKLRKDYSDKYGSTVGAYIDPNNKYTQTAFSVDVKPYNDDGTKNKNYNSDQNTKSVISLMFYLQRMQDDITTLTDITSGHKSLEKNPFALDSKAEDLEKMLNNELKDSFDEKIHQTLYFKPDNPYKLSDNPEVRHYLNVAKKFSSIQKKTNLINNQSVRKILDKIENRIVHQKLSQRQLTHFSEALLPFIYSQLSGLNSKELTDEIIDIFGVNYTQSGNEHIKVNLAQELSAYEDKLEQTDAIEDPEDSSKNTNAFTRSKLFNQGIIHSQDGIRINPQVLQKYYLIKQEGDSEQDAIDSLNEIRKEFSELPLDLQRKLVIYDLVENGFDGPKSLYPLFPKDVTDYISNNASKFQNDISSNAKLTEDLIDSVFKRIKDVEAFNKENNSLPTVFADKPINELNPMDDIKTLIKHLQKNRHVIKKIYSSEPFRVNISSKNDNGQRVTQVVTINPLASVLDKREKNDRFDNPNKRRAMMMSKVRDGHVLVSPVKRSELDLADIPPNLMRLIPNSNMVTIGGNEPFIPNKKNAPLILNKEEIAREKLDLEKKKTNLTGRFFKTNYQFYTKEAALTYEEFLDAYEYKQPLVGAQGDELYLKYEKDKELTEAQKNKFIDSNGNLLEKNPKTNRKWNDNELIDIYKEWGQLDAYATATITVPVMLELINRASAEQSELTGLKEGRDDISSMKAWLQTNNIDGSHPATQAIQRELETEFKSFLNERKQFNDRILKANEALYKEKLGSTGKGFIGRLKLGARLLFANRDKIYQKLYGGIVETRTREEEGQEQKRLQLLSKAKLALKLANGEISQAEYDFAQLFREITNKLDSQTDPRKQLSGGIPHLGPGRLEAFGRKGILGLLTTTRPVNQAIYDVRLNYDGKEYSFKQIEDIFRQEKPNNWKNNIEYLKLRKKANSLYKKRINEDGTKYKQDRVFNHTLLGDGMVDTFANGGWVDANDFLSMDLGKILGDYTHTQLFIKGYGDFTGFLGLQAKVDGLLLHNQLKGFDNQNKFVRKVYKEYFLKAKKKKADTTKDRVIDALVRGNLFYIMGWKLFALQKGLYVIGNSLVGKYNNIKNEGGKSWALGEKRFWGINQNGSSNKKAMGVLKTLNFQDYNIYDDVSISRSTGIDSIFADIALLPMIQSEKWIQGSHFLGLLTEDEWNRFDENGNYKPDTTQITNEKLASLENRVKNSHGKGYSPTDQRMIQRYSWGRAMLQFARFIPTMFYDRFAKEDINIYGEKHIGSLRAVWQPIAKFASGELSPEEFAKYRRGLRGVDKERFDAGLKGMAMVSMAMIAGKALNLETATELAGDANYLINEDKMAYKVIPPIMRTMKNFTEGLVN